MTKFVTPPQRRAWRPNEWLQEVPVSRSQLYEWLKTGKIDSVRVGGTRLITESPTAFIERHRAKPAA